MSHVSDDSSSPRPIPFPNRDAADAAVNKTKQAAIYREKGGTYGIALPIWNGKTMSIIHRSIVLERSGLFHIIHKTIPQFDSLKSNMYKRWSLKELHAVKIEDSSVIVDVVKTLNWLGERAQEIPFLVQNPDVLVNKYYRKRVRDAMANIKPIKVQVKLSDILPAHPLEGNPTAVSKNKERIEALKKNKPEFDKRLKAQEPLTQEFIEGNMESSSPIQLAYDKASGKCIAFDGNSRLIAIKRFFAEAYPGVDPIIEINAYPVAPDLIKHAIPKSDYSLPPK